MKMPDPRAWTTMGQIRFTKPPENSIYEYAPLYDKQALRDLLEAAAREASYYENHSITAKNIAAAIRLMKAKL